MKTGMIFQIILSFYFSSSDDVFERLMVDVDVQENSASPNQPYIFKNPFAICEVSKWEQCPW